MFLGIRLKIVLVYVFRTGTNIVNGISGAVTTEVSCVTLGQGKVLDLKFLYDDSLLVLWALQGAYSIYPLNYSSRLAYADRQYRPSIAARPNTA